MMSRYHYVAISVRKYALALIIVFMVIPGRGFANSADTSGVASADSGAGSVGVAVFPIISYSLETRWVLGTMLYTNIIKPDTTERQRPSLFMPSVMYTQNKQLTLQLEFDHYWNRATRRIFGSVVLVKFPDRFYGIGNDLPDEYELFTPRSTLVNVNYQHGITRNINIGGGFNFEKVEMVKVEPGGLLDTGSIPGADGGRITGLSLLTTWDSRDHTNYPMDGFYLDLGLKQFAKPLGSDFQFAALELDTRYYLTLSASQVLAFQMQLRDISGSAPFQYLSTLGGYQSMRGYYTGRYRHNDKFIIQGEYRLSLPGKLGLVLFACVGDVNSTLKNMMIRDFKYSYGLGIRYLLLPDSKSNLRVDFGYGKDTSGVNVGISEVF
ncbi:MAG: BamA/TamA family outer membrane protein [Fidelibacterota bacterium]|nr:MAG: BamA/TamA family outer membrane protein [Candidatus Neomarinimicrobiota bacterium]